ncbi:hypothetical protein APR08_001266 [Nocardia amikacinitolerans]|nr:hypothetical protein [Nocardia amikacinitolerans]
MLSTRPIPVPYPVRDVAQEFGSGPVGRRFEHNYAPSFVRKDNMLTTSPRRYGAGNLLRPRCGKPAAPYLLMLLNTRLNVSRSMLIDRPTNARRAANGARARLEHRRAEAGEKRGISAVALPVRRWSVVMCVASRLAGRPPRAPPGVNRRPSPRPGSTGSHSHTPGTGCAKADPPLVLGRPRNPPSHCGRPVDPAVYTRVSGHVVHRLAHARALSTLLVGEARRRAPGDCVRPRFCGAEERA